MESSKGVSVYSKQFVRKYMESNTCYICKKDFKTKESLDQHIDSNPKNHSTCNKVIEDKDKDGVEPSTCNICNKEFKTKESLDQHIDSNPKSHLPSEINKWFYSCSVCGSYFPEELDVTQHYYDCHYNQCLQCGECFSNKYDLIHHMMDTHSMELFDKTEKTVP